VTENGQRISAVFELRFNEREKLLEQWWWCLFFQKRCCRGAIRQGASPTAITIDSSI
jgi:hypothetical protein